VKPEEICMKLDLEFVNLQNVEIVKYPRYAEFIYKFIIYSINLQ